MGLLSRLFGGGSDEPLSGEILPAVTKSSSANPAAWFINWIQGEGGHSLSGVVVSPETAMRMAAVWSCVRLRSEDLGKMPLYLYRVDAKGSKTRAYDHPLLTLIRDQPNPNQTALEFRQLLQAWVDLRGNGYALKETDARGRVTALWPINPKFVQVLVVPTTWDIFYRVTLPNAEEITYPAEAMLHIRGMSLDGFSGVSPIAYHRETIGLGIAAEKYGAAFFGNSAQPQGAIKIPTVLGDAAAAKLREDFEARHRGVDNAKRLGIFDGGMEWVQTGIDNVDAQYLETRRFQNEQIYSLYRVPAHKAGDMTRATTGNIEQMALEYVSDCLLTEMVRWEQCLKRDLLTAEEKKTYYFEFMPDALLRGDTPSRYQAYAMARNWGIMSVNEIRDKENMNRVPNGDEYLRPLNMVPAGTPPPPAPGTNPPHPVGSEGGTGTESQSPGEPAAKATPPCNWCGMDSMGAKPDGRS